MAQKLRRRLVLAAGTCLALLAGCGAHDTDAGRVLQVAQYPDPDELNSQQNAGSQVYMGLCEPLTGLGIADAGDIRMRGAERVDTTDGLVWTIKLRPGREFQNGEPITAQTYADTWNAVAYGPNAYKASSTFSVIDGYAELNEDQPQRDTLRGLEVLDELTLRVTLTQPDYDFPKIIASYAACPIPKDGLADPTAYSQAPVGNGPYQFVRWDRNERIVLKRWHDYQGEVPPGAAEEIHFKIYQSQDTAYRDVQAGQLDVLRNLPGGLLNDARNQLGDEGLFAIPQQRQITQMLIPEYIESLKDPRLRKAISLSIDRDAMAGALLRGSATPARSLIVEAVGPAYRADACEYCTYDPERARQLVAEAGGFKEPVFLWYSNTGGGGGTEMSQIALAIANALRQELGADVRLRPVLPAQLTQAQSSGTLTGPSLSLWGDIYPSPDQYLGMFREGGDGNEYTQYDNPAANELIAKALATGDELQAAQYWQQAEDLILEDMPGIPLFYPGIYAAHAPCAKPGTLGGDLQYYLTAFECGPGREE
ncbi:peptide/nickel transport system substrate-binding protein [Saccharopolyspora kobensis]|uniref:Peptide/nickel transport system substrate-binding protein n=1 Tax=Saccharopolyspora kobensis TaxID=146035 RepID=A0A1H6A2M9_9PSEU|nr:ABC transporter substrate-binding protein [Saccharopolyspora kobensis]SEG42691.1 peptide/nickel transport system substrate-binding protein [Saccharopolyspora kobensis]SFE18299.1 peptide/nickel transport system substrate-binding protein/oligopeptide transport system substrate-binding protein [Saccharopolyspora kobensis]